MKPVACVVDSFSGVNPQAEPKPAPGNFRSGAKNTPRHVLVIDDEPLIRWSVAESLADLGFDVEQAADAASGLRAVTTSATPFDVLIVDLRLPDMDDLSLVGTLRQLAPRATLVVMTAFGTPEIVAQAEDLGATVLNKPFELDELKDLVAG